MSLPPEVTDCIIDHCHADRKSLSTCGMVCKSWYPASRYHLFSAVEISNNEGKGFHYLLQNSRLSGVTITPYLQELSFHLRAGDTETWLADLVSALPEYVPLRTLRVFCHGFHLPEEVQQKLATTFRSITSLALFESTLRRRSLANDVAFICSFKNVENILFYGHHRHEMHIPQNITLPSRVQTLKLDLPGPGTESVMRWLLSHEQRIPLVSALHVFRTTDDHNPALRAYLKACRNKLTDVMLFLYQCRTDPGEHPHSRCSDIPPLICTRKLFSGFRFHRIYSVEEHLLELQRDVHYSRGTRVTIYRVLRSGEYYPSNKLLRTLRRGRLGTIG